MSQEIDLETWMHQVNQAVVEFNEVIEGLNERLLAVEGHNWALTLLLHSLIRVNVIPTEAARSQISEMMRVLKETSPLPDNVAFLDAALALYEKLAKEEEPPQPPPYSTTPRFGVIKGGKDG